MSTSSKSKSVFLIGPGLVGREILDLLLAEQYSVTTLVRRESYAAEIRESAAAAGAQVQTVVASLDDSSTIQAQTVVHDVVIHTATADHLASVEAVIAGVEARARLGKQTIFIHTSGTSLLSDDSRGEYRGDRIFDDARPQDIDALPDTAAHREIDLAIVRARDRLASAGARAKLAIVIPPLIYGLNPKYGRLSIQLPTLTRFALKHGYAGHVGKGASVWSDIHVFDLARAYVVLLHWLERDDSDAADDLRANPYFFCESGHDFSWADAAAVIGKELHNAGRIPSPVPTPIPVQNYDDLFGHFTPWVVGSNSRSRATRLRSLGWEPREKSLFDSLTQDEIPLILQENLDTFHGYAGVAVSGVMPP
ncbi:hypothetical protein A1O3_02052 [Capronia epimyces CBS 606.96]|uniref:NAD-dependent epimerase/dehydratase domain-containing protein n=1 Tax=Capronia epimyces CBS 606.96 TaxID=1182542 RepID=W9Y8Y6_9EURO|nr:uncharacterized protein A1O3_02052 [Capronia epimyces CBS 606.96]EXJ88988.1 hypothetical protein A1O3_02052 [Capronia epimyces CBS 606.96]